ncbi:hypothetical protein [Peterkaempfera griseoplana]|uniref:hypothetical protein n=1 Tax=Peterkaempfera griseoplana TaxID=66896 RepID=UPI0006E40E6C|nr:hypothetical protein [Peterkaempfera griseoplana]
MRSADTEFVGGPLDGRVLPILLSPFNNVPKVYRVPVPAHLDRPATTLEYHRAKQYDARGRWRWRYEYGAPDGGGEAAAG